MSNLWKDVKEEIRYQLNEFRPFIALAGTQTDGRLTIRRVTEATAGSEQFARVAGADIAVGDEIVCLIVGGKPLVLGKLQRTAPPAPPAPDLRDIAITRMAHKAAYVNGLATSPTMVGLPTPVTGGTITNADDTEGPWLQHATTATSSSTAYIIAASSVVGAGGVRPRQWQTDVEFIVKTPSDITSIRLFAGLMSDTPIDSSPTVHAICFRFDSAVDGTAWQTFLNDNSGSGTSVSSGVTIAASTLYRFRITVNGNTCLWYINDVLVRTADLSSATNAPPVEALM